MQKDNNICDKSHTVSLLAFICTKSAWTDFYLIFNCLSICYRHGHSILVDWRGRLLFLPFLLPSLIASDDHGDDQKESDYADDNDDWDAFFAYVRLTGVSVSTVYKEMSVMIIAIKIDEPYISRHHYKGKISKGSEYRPIQRDGIIELPNMINKEAFQ